ncbi:hypothetical protein pqer_cds_383 [Pandoravirus quercus]|uniref:Uncharacterized protein n=1 Tax=Pandoravirus quercus TaxID=2107709 RepID=A0A2U7U8U5_9VIRU|nr:hypothetical protein pqer_cds_383 [Pandoravirus quercus]AVK74805.1 hypothetical protein pqer_cds_383 [Pandoravirus quercus]
MGLPPILGPRRGRPPKPHRSLPRPAGADSVWMRWRRIWASWWGGADVPHSFDVVPMAVHTATPTPQ